MTGNVYDKVLLDVISRIPKQYAPILVGATPAENGIGIAWTGGTEKWYRHTSAAKTSMTVVLNAKHKSQATALNALSRIHAAMNAIRRFEPTDAYRIFSIKTQNAPAFAGREKSGQWVYVSSLTVTFATNP